MSLLKLCMDSSVTSFSISKFGKANLIARGLDWVDPLWKKGYA